MPRARPKRQGKGSEPVGAGGDGPSSYEQMKALWKKTLQKLKDIMEGKSQAVSQLSQGLSIGEDAPGSGAKTPPLPPLPPLPPSAHTPPWLCASVSALLDGISQGTVPPGQIDDQYEATILGPLKAAYQQAEASGETAKAQHLALILKALAPLDQPGPLQHFVAVLDYVSDGLCSPPVTQPAPGSLKPALVIGAGLLIAICLLAALTVGPTLIAPPAPTATATPPGRQPAAAATAATEIPTATAASGSAGPGGQPAACDPQTACGDGVCEAACENSDLCPSDCSCADNGVCEPGEGLGCRDCGANAGGCGNPCADATQCAAGLTCAAGICWDACACGGDCGGDDPGGGSGGRPDCSTDAERACIAGGGTWDAGACACRAP